MEPEEYARLERLDQDHWFYRGKRAIVRHWIEHYRPLGPGDLLLDAGMGTGVWLLEMSRVCQVMGLDDHAESLALARPRLEAAGGQVLRTSLEHVNLPDGHASVVTLLDVLEHLADDGAALREMLRLTRAGGLVVITVPALQWLWSDWDTALHHRRRYTRGQLLALVRQPGVEVLRCAYFNWLTLPAIAAVRLWRHVFPPPAGALRAEDKLPPAWLNAALYQTLVVPARWSCCRSPLGVSLLAVLRKAEP